VRVGEEKKELFLHKNLLYHVSLYFKTRFNGSWGKETTVDLAHEEVDTFQAFFAFIYAGKLWDRVPRPNKRKAENDKQGDQNTDAQATNGEKKKSEKLVTIPLTVEQLCRIYVYGDIRLAPTLKCSAINAICQRISEKWDYPYKLTCVFDNTPEHSGLRLLSSTCSRH
jgi:hypothetical protein